MQMFNLLIVNDTTFKPTTGVGPGSADLGSTHTLPIHTKPVNPGPSRVMAIQAEPDFQRCTGSDGPSAAAPKYQPPYRHDDAD